MTDENYNTIDGRHSIIIEKDKDLVTLYGIDHIEHNENDDKSLSMRAIKYVNEETEDEEDIKDDEENIFCLSRFFNIFKRIVRRLRPVSLYGSTFSLTILTVGSACLTFPQRYSQMSFLVAFLGTILGGVLTYWTLNLLVISGLRHNVFDYSKLVKMLYGKFLGVILDLTILFYTFGVIILYSVICKL